MENFQTVFVFSPPPRPNAASSKEKSPKKLECLILKPFSSTPRIDFNNVQIGSSSVEKFEIANPSNKDLTVILVTPPDFTDRGFILNQSSIVILKNSTVTAEIQWKPTEILSWNGQIHVKIAGNPRYCGKINVNSKSSVPKKKLGKRNASTYVVPKVQSSGETRRETYEVPFVEAKFNWQSPKSAPSDQADALVTPNKTFIKCEQNSILDTHLSLGTVLNETRNVDVAEPDFHQALLDISYGTIASKLEKIDEASKAEDNLDISIISHIDETPMKKRCLMSIENTPPAHSSTPLISKISIKDKENFLVPKTPVKKLNFSRPADSNFSAKCPSFDDFLFNYGITTISNPFAKNAVYPLKWVEQYSMELIKWLNSILMPHKELTDTNTNVDLPSLWKKAIASEKLLLAPTKEVASSKYHQNEQHLLVLRKGAKKFFKSEKIIQVLKVVHTKVERGFFEIKDELDLCVDQGVRYKMVQLIMYYNPLWLRIALETIFNQQIDASSKTLAGALVLFLKNNFLTNKTIVAKNLYTNTKCRMPTFRKEMNDYITFKFLSLIFFLDQAKINHLIPYDPCLFNKSSPIKDSESIFTEFIKEFVKCVSHMKRTMSNIGYTLLYKQTPFHEFDFAVKTHLDLRDGVSLAKSMEIILKDKNVCNTLLMPAISRLQKVHNVKITMDALLAQGFAIEDVTAYDIVNGHREKTMSLLWQILHKFLAPRYEAAARKIQGWWRNASLFRVIKLRIEKKRQEKLSKMATLIQSTWRGFYVRKYLKTIIENLKEEKRKRDAVILIQRKFRANASMRKLRTEYLTIRNAAIHIQRWYRFCILMKTERKRFLKMRSCTVLLQQRYRATLLMRKQLAIYQLQKNSTVRIQQWYRSTKLMREQTEQYHKLRTSAIIVQQCYRAMKAMSIQRAKYQRMRNAAIQIQQWYRATKWMKLQAMDYQKLRVSVIKIQQQYRAMKAMKKQYAEYQQIRNATIRIQEWYRACSLMKIEFARYQKIKSSAIIIQQRYRATVLMRRQWADYTLKRNCVLRIQQWYRATKLMREQTAKYCQLRTSVITIQQQYRATKAMRKQQAEYQQIRNAAMQIQEWYRACSLMNIEFARYQKIKSSAIIIQQRYRATVLMRRQWADYTLKRNSVLRIQQWYRATKLMKEQSAKYCQLKKSVITIQQRYRAIKAMRKQQTEYQRIKNAAMQIQAWYRACSLMKIEFARYKEMKSSAIVIQQRYRATVLMRTQLADYQLKRNSALCIQQWYRATKLMRLRTEKYEKLRKSVIIIQNKYRAIRAMRKAQAEYQCMKSAVICIQRWYKTSSLMKIEFTRYQEMKSSAVVIQRRYRATVLMRRQLADYQLKRKSALRIQQWYRATKLMKEQSAKYRQLRTSIIIIQRRYQAIKAMRKQQAEYQRIRYAAMQIQAWYRACTLMKIEFARYQEMKTSAVVIQQQYRATVLMRRQSSNYQLMRNAVLRIQQWYRATKLMKEQSAKYRQLRTNVITIQQRYRAIKAMRIAQTEYQTKRNAAIRIQEWYRATMIMKQQFVKYNSMKISVIRIQRWYRATKSMRNQRLYYLHLRNSTIRIQQWYKATKKMQLEATYYKQLRASVIIIEKRYRTKCRIRDAIAEYKKLKDEKHRREIAAFKIQRWYKRIKQNVAGNQLRVVAKQICASKRQKNITLAAQFPKIIATLRRSNQITVVVEETAKLDRIVRHSPKLGLDLAKLPDLNEILFYHLAVECRSEPYQNILKSILGIFINISLNKNAVNYLWEIIISENGLMIIGTVMNKYYKSNSEIFCKAVTLLWILSQCDERSLAISRNPEICKRLKFLMGKIPRSNQVQKLPDLRPNFGYGRNWTNEFKNPHFAMYQLLSVLKI